jgi:DNA-binding MurR/RpiR family transcriptional regulator
MDDAMSYEEIAQAIKQKFESMSPQLRKAATFVTGHPQEVALHSMRKVAAKADVHPSTMIRLAGALSFDSYDDFRGHFQHWLTSHNTSISGRAHALRDQAKSGTDAVLVDDMVNSDIVNLQKTFAAMPSGHLEAARALIEKSRVVYIIGNRSLYPAAFCFHYTASLLSDKFVLVSGLGGTAADELRSVTSHDALVAFGYSPYTSATVQAVRFAARRKVPIIAVTDSILSPLGREATVTLPVSNESRLVFHSIVPAIELAQVLTGLIIAAQDEGNLSRALARSEAQLQEFNVYVEE